MVPIITGIAIGIAGAVVLALLWAMVYRKRAEALRPGLLPAGQRTLAHRRAAVSQLHRHLEVHGHVLPGRAGAAAQRQLSSAAGVLKPL